MRRFCLWCAVSAAWSLAGIGIAHGQSSSSAPAAEQTILPDAPPARKRLIFSMPKVAPATEPAAESPSESTPAPNRDASDGRDGDRGRDGYRGHDGEYGHHHHDNGNWLLWPPLVWYGGYPSIYPPYGQGYPSFPQQGFGVMLPAPAVDAPARAPVAQPSDKPKVRVTNSEWKARAGKFIGFGDANFGKQSYLAAAERYKTAAEMAPDLAEPLFRQGFALVAMGQYESAAKAFRRGLRIRSDWTDSPFRLDQIYADDQIAKTAHIENLAKAVEANPLDSELLVALGMQIFFDGQPERAEVFFARAAELGANDDELLDSFLARPGPAGAPRPANAPKPVGKIVF